MFLFIYVFVCVRVCARVYVSGLREKRHITTDYVHNVLHNSVATVLSSALLCLGDVAKETADVKEIADDRAGPCADAVS